MSLQLSQAELAAPVALEPASAPVWEKLFSFPVMVAFALAALAVFTAHDRFSDPDLWWHLKTGEIIWNTHIIPATDVFSFTTNNHAWTAHEWLSELLIYSAWKAGGYTGLMLLLAVGTSLLLIAQYALCSLYSGNPKVALLGALIAWLFATVGIAIRPHLLGYLLLTCELLILQLGRLYSPRWFLFLPPLFLFWVNCHGWFMFGLIVLSTFVFCSFFEARIGPLTCVRWTNSQRRVLVLAFLLSTAALFVNPIGLKQVLYPFDLLVNQPAGLAAVAEWRPPSFDNFRAVALLTTAGAILVLMWNRQSGLELPAFLLVALGFAMALHHTRMLFLFGLLAAPVLCRLISQSWRGYDPTRDRRLPNAIVMLASLAAVVLAFPGSHQLQLQVERENPVKAVEFIRRTGLSGRMVNEYVYGGYLIWAAPENKVFVDGRSDVYDWTGVLRQFGSWATLQSDPAALLDKFKIDFCLLSRDAPMSHVLPHLPGWKLIYSDGSSVIFARQARNNRC